MEMAFLTGYLRVTRAQVLEPETEILGWMDYSGHLVDVQRAP